MAVDIDFDIKISRVRRSERFLRLLIGYYVITVFMM